jgi:hypothetical protein
MAFLGFFADAHYGYLLAPCQFREAVDGRPLGLAAHFEQILVLVTLPVEYSIFERMKKRARGRKDAYIFVNRFFRDPTRPVLSHQDP